MDVSFYFQISFQILPSCVTTHRWARHKPFLQPMYEVALPPYLKMVGVTWRRQTEEGHSGLQGHALVRMVVSFVMHDESDSCFLVMMIKKMMEKRTNGTAMEKCWVIFLASFHLKQEANGLGQHQYFAQSTNIYVHITIKIFGIRYSLIHISTCFWKYFVLPDTTKEESMTMSTQLLHVS